MGNTQADGFAEAVREGYASLRQAIAANLTSNHYPPLPTTYVSPIIEAIYAVENPFETGGGYEEIGLPADIMPRPRLAWWEDDAECWIIRAGDLLDITHSWCFVESDDDEEDDL